VRASVRIAGRVAAAVAFGATAALAVTLTRGAPLHAALVSARHVNAVSRHAERSAPQCAASGLNVSIASSSSADSAASIARRAASHAAPQGATRFPVEFTNISDAPCTLSGYPQVTAYGAGDEQLGNAAGLDISASATRILLAPGATAHAAIVDSASAGQCGPVAATGLRVVPPGESMPWYVRHALPACSATGRKAAVYLHVRALQYGSGMSARAGAKAIVRI
jgi:Protein of unknown function (DUF4232)